MWTGFVTRKISLGPKFCSRWPGPVVEIMRKSSPLHCRAHTEPCTSPDTSLCFAQFYLMVNLLGCPSPCHSLSTHRNEPDQQIAKKVITLAND